MKKRLKLVFWGIAILGLLLPLVVEIIVGLIMDPRQMLRFYTSHTKEALSGLLLASLSNDIPFIALAILVLRRIGLNIGRDTEGQYSKNFYRQRSGVIGAAIAVIGVSLLLNIAYWVDLYGPSCSSTGCLVFIFIPIYGLILMPLGYGCGWILGRKK